MHCSAAILINFYIDRITRWFAHAGCRLFGQCANDSDANIVHDKLMIQSEKISRINATMQQIFDFNGTAESTLNLNA